MTAVFGAIGEGSHDQLSRMAVLARRPGETIETYLHEAAAFAVQHRDTGEILARRGASPDPTPVVLMTGRASVGEQRDESALRTCLADSEAPGWESLDGAFAAAAWHPGARRLDLVCDPFGVRTVYIAESSRRFCFASDLRVLLGAGGISRDLDLDAIHHYLTFSFVPGSATPLLGVRRLPAGSVATWQDGSSKTRPYVHFREIGRQAAEPAPASASKPTDRVHKALLASVERRQRPGERSAVALSGGLDSAAVAWAMCERGERPEALMLDFGRHGVERNEARLVAHHLGLKLTRVRVTGRKIRRALPDLINALELPYGDPVTGPQHLLASAARAHGIDSLWNGEGGDQLFGGWSNKPMLAAALHGAGPTPDAHADGLLQMYHRFYGLEDRLYTEDFRRELGTDVPTHALESRDSRVEVVRRELEAHRGGSFLHALRRVDIRLRGAGNLLPRCESVTRWAGLDVRVPLFDRALVDIAMALAPDQLLRGAREKFVLKHALEPHLPRLILDRPKSGMCPPVTRWVMGPMRGWIRELLGPESLKRRGLFRCEYVASLCRGVDSEAEIRGRRLGEKLWTLLMLEAWLRVFIDEQSL